jgi:hypothetical protein
MRRMSAALVAICAAIALVALAAPAWASPKPTKTTTKSLSVSPTEVRPGQLVKVSGGGCRGITVLIFFVDGQSFHHGMTRSGDWSYRIKLPTSVRSGTHDLQAQCRGTNFRAARFHVSHRSSFDVSPDTIHAGGRVHADGNGCRRNSHVRIKLDGETISRFHADEHGTFDKRVRIPKHTKRGRHLVSAVCGHRFIGADGIKVKKKYSFHHHRHHHGHHHHDGDHMRADHSVVKPGQKVRISGDDCPDGVATASLDGAPVTLKVAHQDGGFTATATVPRGTAPGKHQLYAGCDAGSSGTTELNVLDPDSTDTAAEHKAFAPQPSSDLAMWAGLFAGLSLLVASVVLTTRRRSNRG